MKAAWTLAKRIEGASAAQRVPASFRERFAGYPALWDELRKVGLSRNGLAAISRIRREDNSLRLPYGADDVGPLGPYSPTPPVEISLYTYSDNVGL